MPTIVTFGLGKEHGGDNIISCGAEITLINCDIDLMMLNSNLDIECTAERIDAFFDEDLTINDCPNNNITINK